MKRLTLALVLLLAAGCSLFVRPELDSSPSPKEDEARRAVSVSSIDSNNIAPGVTDSPYWAKIRAGGPLIVGVNRSYPPFGAPTRDGSWVGFDVDLAKHLGQVLGVPIQLVGIRSQDAMNELGAGRIDLAMAGLTRTVFRSAQISFSAPYLVVTQGALVERRYVEGSRGTDEERRRNTLESYFDLAEINGLKVAAVKWTRPHRLAITHLTKAKITAFDTLQEASQALIDNKVDALVHDAPYIRAWPLIHPDAAGRFRALIKPVTEEPIAIAIRKGDLEFLRFLDAYVGEVRGDGTVERILRRHFVDAEWAKTADLGGKQ
jgi:polar amino acid transport system substrate-binding protein